MGVTELLNHDFRFIKAYLLFLDKHRFLEMIEVLGFRFNDNKKVVQLFLDEEIKNRLKIFEYETEIFLSTNILGNLLTDMYFRSWFLNLDVYSIDSLIERGLVLPSFLYEDKTLLDKYLNMHNVERRRIFINNLIKNNYSLYEILNDKLIKLDDEKMEHILDEKDDEPNTILTILIDRYFGDVAFNIYINIEMIVNFIKKVDKILINEERLYWYDLIVNFEKQLLERQIEIYKNMPKHIDEWLYEDFRTCQNYSYKLINESITDFRNLKTSVKNGVTIYELNGEYFIFPIHVTDYSRVDDDFSWGRYVKTISLSLIGSMCLGTYKDNPCYVMVGFNRLNTKDIMHIYHADSFSSGEQSSRKINEIYTPLELLEKTCNYNEILVAQNILNNIRLTPDYLVCYDKVFDGDIKRAKQLNVPIVLINTSCYPQKMILSDINDYGYVRTRDDLNGYMYRKGHNFLLK